MGAPCLFVARRRARRPASLNRELHRAVRSAQPYGAAFGAERAHTLVEDRAIKIVRRYRGAGQLAEPGKDFFELLPGLQFQRCAARRKRSGHHFSIAGVPKPARNRVFWHHPGSDSWAMLETRSKAIFRRFHREIKLL